MPKYPKVIKYSTQACENPAENEGKYISFQQNPECPSAPETHIPLPHYGQNMPI